ncbi:TlpA disulfide reductase family protein [Teredinibacter sp. KSP-S5-2]|uniref:TlpA family protein disulfide reductase n=1 Tax=Teredinibacter sp. KSP-S5-2 TaxID=3034506 RepID=UPI002935283B|nr:TlpA disulfide reductase family protein [Teredinibacter sp. KSP-S5-2]WNO09431.1 TlpA disulfide reductase family protein [Teredinibacter sp. KSP-S5-2]
MTHSILKRLGIFFLPLGLCLNLVVNAAETPQVLTDIQSENMAPNWMISTVSGKELSLYSELEQGNSVVMVFWASWCRHCRELLPAINTLNQEIEGRKIKIFALNIWEDGEPLRYLNNKKIELETALKCDNVAKRFGIKGTPGVIVVGPDKKIVYRRQAGQKVNEVIAKIKDVTHWAPDPAAKK